MRFSKQWGSSEVCEGERRSGCTFGGVMSQDWWMVSLREERIGDVEFQLGDKKESNGLDWGWGSKTRRGVLYPTNLQTQVHFMLNKMKILIC